MSQCFFPLLFIPQHKFLIIRLDLMPTTKLYVYQESKYDVPLVKWLDSLPNKVQVKCRTKIERLRQCGAELRRPEADYLRDGIYELRVGFRGRHYRILYPFAGKDIILLSHGVIKEDRVPPVEIDLALQRKINWESFPDKYTFTGEI